MTHFAFLPTRRNFYEWAKMHSSNACRNLQYVNTVVLSVKMTHLIIIYAQYLGSCMCNIRIYDTCRNLQFLCTQVPTVCTVLRFLRVHQINICVAGTCSSYVRRFLLVQEPAVCRTYLCRFLRVCMRSACCENKKMMHFAEMNKKTMQISTHEQR